MEPGWVAARTVEIMNAWKTVRAVLATKLALLLLLPLSLLDLSTSIPGKAMSSMLLCRRHYCFHQYMPVLIFTDDGPVFLVDFHDPDLFIQHPDVYVINHRDAYTNLDIWAPAIERSRCSLSVHRYSDYSKTHDSEILSLAKDHLFAEGYWYEPLHAEGSAGVRYTVLWGGLARNIFGPVLLLATLWSVMLNAKGGARAIAERHRTELLRRRICPSCRYSLADLPGEEPTCPECGSSWSIETSENNSAPESAPGR